MEEITDAQSRVLGDILSQLGFERQVNIEYDDRYVYNATEEKTPFDLCVTVIWQDAICKATLLEPYTVRVVYTTLYELSYFEHYNIEWKEGMRPPHPIPLHQSIEDAITYFKQFLG